VGGSPERNERGQREGLGPFKNFYWVLDDLPGNTRKREQTGLPILGRRGGEDYLTLSRTGEGRDKEGKSNRGNAQGGE